MLTVGRRDTNTHSSDVSHNLVVGRRADDGIGVEVQGDTSSLRSTFSFEGFSTSLIMAKKVMDASKINPPRNRQSHWRPVYYHWIGSGRECKEESSQQGCREHVWEKRDVAHTLIYTIRAMSHMYQLRQEQLKWQILYESAFHERQLLNNVAISLPK